MSSCGGDKAKEEVAAPKKEEVKNEVIKIDPKSDKGIGPVSSVTIGDIDNDLVAKGEVYLKLNVLLVIKSAKSLLDLL